MFYEILPGSEQIATKERKHAPGNNSFCVFPYAFTRLAVYALIISE